MADTTCELKWLKRLLGMLGFAQNVPIQMHCESKLAIHIDTNHVFHELTKHVENDCHTTRDAVKAKLLSLEHISTKEQPADLLTKALPTPTFQYLMFKLGIRNTSLPT